MTEQQFGSVWDAIEEDGQMAENMKARSALMIALAEHIRACGWTQVQAAHNMKVSQPRISDLIRGKINLFSLDMLVNMLAASGLGMQITIFDKNAVATLPRLAAEPVAQ